MPANATELKDIGSSESQDGQQFQWLLSDIKSPLRSESAPPLLAGSNYSVCSSSDQQAAGQQAVLGRSNLSVSEQFSSPWSRLSWDSIVKHRSLDSRHLESLAEEAGAANSFFSTLASSPQTHPSTSQGAAAQQRQLIGPGQTLQHLPAFALSPGMGSQQPDVNNSVDAASTSGSAADVHSSPQHPHSRSQDAQEASGSGALDDAFGPPLSLSPLRLGGESQQPASPSAARPSNSNGHSAQQAGQGSSKQGSHQRGGRAGQPQGAGPSWHMGAMGHQRGLDGVGYLPYPQPPPPPPIHQSQRPSMQWHAGQSRTLPPRTHESGVPQRMVPPQPQQQMGVGPMGMYSGVVPYGLLPGMHQQAGVQQPVYLPNGYMMTYYPQMAQGSMAMFRENGAQGSGRPPGPYQQSAPFPPALDPHYAEYMQHLAQQQVFPGVPVSSLSRADWTSKSGNDLAQGNKGGSEGLRGRLPNGHHRRTSSALSAASSAHSADRDRSNRQVPDRRGDSATATNSNAGGAVPEGLGASADPEHAAQAAVLLEEFKAKSKNQNFELADIKGFVNDFCRDQHGSRFIQQKLAEASSQQVMAVFEEVQPHVIALMQDVFGNYVIQKCFEHGSQELLEALAGVIQNHVLPLSLQMYGCRVIQKALEVLPLEQQRIIVKELQGQVMRCVRDQNGNHVIQKSIERVKPTTEIQSMVEDIKGNVVSLSAHPYGCRVIQRVLEHCTIDDVKDLIRQEILQATAALTIDQYGNYVIQHMLEHGPDAARQEISERLAGQVVRLSQHKFASNVIEKCLQYGNSDTRKALIQEVLGRPEGPQPDSATLQALTKDPYANYVVQKMLEVCDDSQRQLLMSCITAHLTQLKKLTYGKHIVARIEKLLAAGNAAANQQTSQAQAEASSAHTADLPGQHASQAENEASTEGKADQQ